MGANSILPRAQRETGPPKKVYCPCFGGQCLPSRDQRGDSHLPCDFGDLGTCPIYPPDRLTGPLTALPAAPSRRGT